MSRIRVERFSSISVPVCVGWKCSKCGTLNHGEGSLVISDYIKTFIGRLHVPDFKPERDWKPYAVDLIKNPIKNAEDLSDSIYLNNYKCSNCRKREIWSRKKWYANLGWAAFIASLISYGIAKNNSTILSWLFFGLLVALSLYCIFLDVFFKYFLQRVLKKLPQDSLPAIACLNDELHQYAKSINQSLLTPELFGPSIYAVANEMNDKELSNSKADESPSQAAPNTTTTEGPQSVSADKTDHNAAKDSYCYKCGNKLKEESDFCSYCGADLRKG